MIPDRLIDKKLKSGKYAPYFYTMCIIIRILIGLLVFYNKIPNIIIYILSAFIITIFSYKYIYNKGTWKNYINTVITYILLSIFTLNNKNTNNIGGVFVIINALLGNNTKYITSNFIE